MNTCPKCGSPQAEEQTNYAKETGRTWWVCGTFQTRDCHPNYSELCLEREEKNTLQRKVEELQVALDFANEAIDQRERSRTEAETKRDKWRECASRLLHYAECLLARIPDKSEINWTVLEQARSMFKEVSK